MFSQSGARIADTDAFSRLDTELSCLTKYVMIQNFNLKKQLLFQNFHGLRSKNGGARKRTSQEEGDLQVKRICVVM